MKFKKKPVVIEAHQFDGTKESANELLLWINGTGGTAYRASVNNSGYEVCISTLEGTMTATLGDWIIQGVQGEFYPCKPDIFEATYEPA